MTGEAAQPPLRPLPIRTRPASGESTASYIRRLAVANHLRPMHLRRYLKDPGPDGGIRLSWLAILAGRPVTSLQHALADQQPPGGAPARHRPPDARQRKPSKAELFTLIRRDASERGLSARALADRHGTDANRPPGAPVTPASPAQAAAAPRIAARPVHRHHR